MNYDFRYKNEHGKWESAGHSKGSDRSSAFQTLIEKADGGMPAGTYMSRPRGRQKDWDLFLLDPDGNIARQG